MLELTLLLFERMGMLLILAFMLTRIPTFRHLLERKMNWKMSIYHSFAFGVFGFITVQSSVLFHGSSIVAHWLIYRLEAGETLVGSASVAIVVAGLLGGPLVGFLSGILVGIYLLILGGEPQVPVSIFYSLAGIMAGLTARFFSQERVIAPLKALFIGMFIPILHMGFLLIFTSTPEATRSLVNQIGLPLVITNSVAIALFTAMIRVALHEQERGAAVATQQALRIAEETLPFLRQGLNFETATEIAKLLRQELKIAAVTITDRDQVLAHNGVGSDHHKQGELLRTHVSRVAIETGEVMIVEHREQIQCSDPSCLLQAAILMPLRQSGEVVGLVKMYFQRPQQLRSVDIALAQGLGKLISNQLDIVTSEKMKSLMQEAQLRNLQAQIHPHFLFNTLHLISTLIRVNPSLARKILVRLGQFMRFNIKSTSLPIIQLREELEQLKAYMEIMKIRFSDQLTIDFDIQNGIENVQIPPFTLLPLVDNCIRHGLKDITNGGCIRVCVRRAEREVEVEIIDNGQGIPSEILHQLGQMPVSSLEGNGIGIYHVNQRLIGLLGSGSALRFQNHLTGPNQGCSVSFHIPYDRKGGEMK